MMCMDGCWAPEVVKAASCWCWCHAYPGGVAPLQCPGGWGPSRRSHSTRGSLRGRVARARLATDIGSSWLGPVGTVRHQGQAAPSRGRGRQAVPASAERPEAGPRRRQPNLGAWLLALAQVAPVGAVAHPRCLVLGQAVQTGTSPRRHPLS